MYRKTQEINCEYDVEGFCVYNRENQILEQYPFEVKQTIKGRGALICDTDKGLKILKEYKGSEGRAEFLYGLLEFLKEQGQENIDCIVKNKEEKTITIDTDGTAYMVRDWYEGRECDTKNREDILCAVQRLAKLHKVMREFPLEIPEYLQVQDNTLLLENEKHTRELKKVRNYVYSRKKKNRFEQEFLRSYPMFYEEARQVMELQERELQQADTSLLYGICHGDYNQHNVIFTRQGLVVLNFERASYDVQAGDLGNFMRKIMEKHNWNMGLGVDMLAAYEKVRPMTSEELKQLYIRLAYPEKFWKIANHYFNSSKAWVCGRNLEKLEKIIGQNEARETFLLLMKKKV